MQENSTTVQEVYIDAIIVEDRMRSELGNIDDLTNSISEFGLIVPIILAQERVSALASALMGEAGEGLYIRLVDGGRRLTALKRLGWKAIPHGEGGFLWNSEANNDPLRRKAIELEANLRRKELTWQEQALGRRQLLETMQALHGTVSSGGPRKVDIATGAERGFGVRRLAAMLGISAATVSTDIQIANAITQVPQLAGAATRESVLRMVKTATVVAAMNAAGAAKSVDAPKLWTLYEGDFHGMAYLVPDSTVDLVYTDLPFGVDLGKMSKHDRGVVGYGDSRQSVLDSLGGFARESYRVLRPDRFLVVFFGFNYYQALLDALRGVGEFTVNPVPVIWYKHTRSTENPNTRYGNAYDGALVAMKGSPVFIRPGQTNVVDIPSVLPSERLQIAQQPVELVQKFIYDMTSVGATVLDWCAGSGTTGEAAVRLKRHAILFEKESAACNMIRARLGAL